MRVFRRILVILLVLVPVLMLGAQRKALVVGGKTGIPDIQTAINQAKNGDVIQITAGLYKTKDVLTIQGKTNLVIKAQGVVDIICEEYVHVLKIINSNNITIDGLHMVHSRNATPDGCGPQGNVIHIEQSDRITVQNCELNGCGYIGIYGEDLATLTVKNNYIHTNTSAGIHLYSYSEKNPTLVTIQNNRMYNNYEPVVILGKTYWSDTNEGRWLRMSGNTIYPDAPPPEPDYSTNDYSSEDYYDEEYGW
jgi:parallel beta-helix repeat protein